MLIMGFLLMAVVAYRLAIAPTLELSRQLDALEAAHMDTEGIARMSSNVTQRERFVDSVLKASSIRGGSVQNSLLEYLNQVVDSSKVTIKDFSSPHRAVVNDVPTVSYSFTLEGPFNTLQEIVHTLEQKRSFGSLDHISYLKERDPRTRRQHLHLKVVLTSLEGI